MPGRFALTIPTPALAAFFGIDAAQVVAAEPRWNIAPSQPIIAVRSDGGARSMSLLTWGFPAPPGAAFGPMPNARAETLAQAPTFRDAARQRRCLIPASGWYEWTGEKGAKIPWRARARSGEPLALAAIWEDGPSGPACALVTCAPNALMKRYHHRMPVIVLPEDQAMWLGEAGKGAARLMVPAPEDLLIVERVPEVVNSTRHQGPVEALDPDTKP